MSVTCVNCERNLPFGRDAIGPIEHDAVCGSAVMRSDLLGPLERSVAGPCPANRIMGERTRAAPIVQVRHVDRRILLDAVKRHHLVIGPQRTTFRAGAVIADNVDEQGVVHHAHVIQRVDQSPDLLIGVLAKSGEGFHLPRLRAFFRLAIANPRREFLWDAVSNPHLPE